MEDMSSKDVLRVSTMKRGSLVRLSFAIVRRRAIVQLGMFLCIEFFLNDCESETTNSFQHDPRNVEKLSESVLLSKFGAVLFKDVQTKIAVDNIFDVNMTCFAYMVPKMGLRRGRSDEHQKTLFSDEELDVRHSIIHDVESIISLEKEIQIIYLMLHH